ncbi:MAG: hypothetical protein LUQ50_01560 [Methanospirillum sp.]|uniref:KEOPS complex subunit Pcc1 n=1 Tax=Methanospirillum sp. TaxID=45200 RepID=UPI002374F964|nr:KEOPS complex subunit Pcc1 [Methanospirillum sp.]MDD1727739.1 hypothetical protein [Methanospirillum sp.]
MHTAYFRFEIPYASIINDAVSPEEADENSGRSHGMCRVKSDGILELSVQASDLPALRAALNSWLRLIQVASEMIDRTQI